MNASEQIRLLRRACEMVWDASGNGGDMSDRDWLAKWKATGSPWKIAIDQCRDALYATATPPDYHVADAGKMVAEELKKAMYSVRQFCGAHVGVPNGGCPACQRDDALANVEHWRTKANCYGDIVHGCNPALEACGHPVNDTQSGGAVAGIAEAVSSLAKERDEAREEALDWRSKTDDLHLAMCDVRKERDEALAKLAAANGELETERIRLAACGVIAGCNTPETYALNMRMDESYKCSSIDAVAAAVRREMDLRDKLEAAQKELAGIYAAKTEPGKPIVTEDNEGYLWIGCGIYARELRKVATGVTTEDAQRIADALNGGKP